MPHALHNRSMNVASGHLPNIIHYTHLR